MRPHFSIHSGREQDRRARGERDGRERMTGETVRELGDDLRGGWRDEKEVCAIGELDVTGAPIFLFVIEAGRDRIFGKRLQGERRNKFGRVLRHHDKNLMALPDQETRQLRGFVGGDGSGNSEHN